MDYTEGTPIIWFRGNGYKPRVKVPAVFVRFGVGKHRAIIKEAASGTQRTVATEDIDHPRGPDGKVIQ